MKHDVVPALVTRF